MNGGRSWRYYVAREWLIAIGCALLFWFALLIAPIRDAVMGQHVVFALYAEAGTREIKRTSPERLLAMRNSPAGFKSDYVKDVSRPYPSLVEVLKVLPDVMGAPFKHISGNGAKSVASVMVLLYPLTVLVRLTAWAFGAVRRK